jgi:hypothetical protein
VAGNRKVAGKEKVPGEEKMAGDSPQARASDSCINDRSATSKSRKATRRRYLANKRIITFFLFDCYTYFGLFYF